MCTCRCPRTCRCCGARASSYKRIHRCILMLLWLEERICVEHCRRHRHRRRRRRRRQKCIALLHQTVLNRTDLSLFLFLSSRARKSHRWLIRLIGETVSRIDYPKATVLRQPRRPANPRGKYLLCTDDGTTIKLIGAKDETSEEVGGLCKRRVNDASSRPLPAFRTPLSRHVRFASLNLPSASGSPHRATPPRLAPIFSTASDTNYIFFSLSFRTKTIS